MIATAALRPGDVVLVTGAGSGLGLASAVSLASRGYRVFGAVYETAQEHALEVAVKGAGPVRAVRMDITKRAEVDRCVQTVVAEAGRIDGVVHLAGVGLRGFFEDLTLDEVRQVFDVNVFGTMSLLQAVLPVMRSARRGRIIVTTSIAGRIGSMSISGYASSKFAVEGLIECVAQEVAPFGISISALEPGLILTEHFTKHRNRAKRAVDPSSVVLRVVLPARKDCGRSAGPGSDHTGGRRRRRQPHIDGQTSAAAVRAGRETKSDRVSSAPSSRGTVRTSLFFDGSAAGCISEVAGHIAEFIRALEEGFQGERTAIRHKNDRVAAAVEAAPGTAVGMGRHYQGLLSDAGNPDVYAGRPSGALQDQRGGRRQGVCGRAQARR